MTRSERDRVVYLFVHIPKTGGQTLRNHFINHLTFHEEFIHLGPYGIEDAERRGLKPFAERSPAQRNRAFVILGHHVTSETHRLVPGKTPRYITFLRDPAARLTSLYNFRMHYEHRLKGVPEIPFEEWYGRRANNELIRWICRQFSGETRRGLTAAAMLEAARATLDRFWFVGTVETFADDAAYLMRHLGLPPVEGKANVTGVHFERTLALSDAWRERIYRDNEGDVLLHTFYRERRRLASRNALR